MQSDCFGYLNLLFCGVLVAITVVIANIFTSKPDDKITSGNIISDISDHFTQFCITRTSLEKEKPDKLYTRDYSFFSEARFLNELSQTDWQRPSSENEANVDKLTKDKGNRAGDIVNAYE